MFNIGDMTATTGDSFECSDPGLWYNTPQLSSSGLSNVKKTLTYNYLVNANGR